MINKLVLTLFLPGNLNLSLDLEMILGWKKIKSPKPVDQEVRTGFPCLGIIPPNENFGPLPGTLIGTCEGKFSDGFLGL